MKRSRRRRLQLTAGGLVAACLALHGCFTPPVILEGGRRTLSLAEFPPGTEAVQLPVAPDIAVSGVFVPAGAGAPVALCFLESMGSITYGSRPTQKIGAPGTPGATLTISGFPQRGSAEPLPYQYVFLSQLRALGFSVLVLDYEGVGVSGGVRTPDNLRRDARAGWDEALRRAGGDPQRVVLRGTSVGVLAVATLLQDGARPAAVTLIDPVRAESVATNFGRVKYGVAFTLVASWFFRDAVDVDLLAQLRTLEAPLLVVTPQHDALLLADELAELRGAIEAAQGELRIRELNHDLLAVAGRALLPEERSFYPARLPRLIADRERAAVELWAAAAGTQGWRGLSPAAFDEGAPLRQRLRAIVDQHVLPGAGLPVALALADVSEAQLAQLAAWTWWLPPEMSGTRELDVLAALVDRHDPAGDLNLAFLLDSVHDFGVLAGHPLDELLACYIDSQDPLGSIGASLSVNLLTGDMQVGNSEKWIHSFVADEHRRLIDKIHLSPQDADRQTLRLFLRAAGMAERLGESGQSLELWQDGVWRPLPPLPSWPTRPARPAKAAPAAPAATGEDPGGSSH